MKNKFVRGSLLALPLLLGACTSSNHITDADKGQFVTEFYAYVYDISDVKFESDVGPAAATWGLAGALENSRGDSGDILGGALVGAFFGGLFQAVFEGPRKGYEYELDAVDGDRVTVVLDYSPANVGDCVKVRVASKVSIKRATASLCEMDPYAEENE